MRRAAALGASVLLLLAGVPAPSAAQTAPADSARGWLGIGLREVVDCSEPRAAGARESGDGECRSVLVVQAVFLGSPASESGLAPGDTLLAVDGEPVGGDVGLGPLAELRAGDPVELRVGGAGGQRTVTATPAARPSPRAPVSLRVRGGDPARVSVRVRPRVLVDPKDSVLSVRPPELPEGMVRIRGGAGLHVDDRGRVFLGTDDELVRVRQLERIAARLRSVRDSTFEAARERLRAVRAESRRGTAPPAVGREGGDAWPVVPAGPHRALGAEFWTVGPALARSLRNVEHGMLVLEVVPGTPADELGLRTGDVVVRVGETEVRSARDLRAPFVAPSGAGPIPVRWIRSGTAMTDTLALPGGR